MAQIRKGALFGPAGNSDSFAAEGNKNMSRVPEWVAGRGLDAYEYQCGRGVRGSVEKFREFGELAVKNGIALSLHAPYYISLSSVEEEKRINSIGYIRESIEAAEHLGADIIVIHTGSASKITRDDAMKLAADTVYKTLEALPDTKVRFGLETMGKVNQLGTLDEVITLCRLDPRLWPVVDFGHLNARESGGVFVGEDDYKRVFDKIAERLAPEKAERLHCHFSRIEYTSAGEKKHLTFEDEVYGPDFAPLGRVIAAEGLSPRIICESAGTQAEDAAAMKQMYLDSLTALR